MKQDKNTLSDYKTSSNTVLEQFVGIVPPSTMTEIQSRKLAPSLPSAVALRPPSLTLVVLGSRTSRMEHVLCFARIDSARERPQHAFPERDCLNHGVQFGRARHWNTTVAAMLRVVLVRDGLCGRAREELPMLRWQGLGVDEHANPLRWNVSRGLSDSSAPFVKGD